MSKYMTKCSRAFDGEEDKNTIDVWHETEQCIGCPHAQEPKTMRWVIVGNDIVEEKKPFCIANKVTMATRGCGMSFLVQMQFLEAQKLFGMRYFLFWENDRFDGKVIVGKSKSNYKPLIDKWLSDPDAKEVTKETYDTSIISD